MRFSRLVCCIGRFRGWISRFGRSLVVWSGGLVVSLSLLVGCKIFEAYTH
jgi:hypothetical protein